MEVINLNKEIEEYLKLINWKCEECQGKMKKGKMVWLRDSIIGRFFCNVKCMIRWEDKYAKGNRIWVNI